MIQFNEEYIFTDTVSSGNNICVELYSWSHISGIHTSRYIILTRCRRSYCFYGNFSCIRGDSLWKNIFHCVYKYLMIIELIYLNVIDLQKKKNEYIGNRQINWHCRLYSSVSQCFPIYGYDVQ